LRVFPRIRLTREKALTASTQFLEAAQDRRVQVYPVLGGTTRNAQVAAAFERSQSAAYGWLYVNRPAVRTVIDYIARNLAQLPLQLFERVDDTNRERLYDHPAAELMKYPDDLTPQTQFIFRFTADFLVYDNAYLVKFRPPEAQGRLLLQRVPPYLMSVSGGRFYVERYRMHRFDGSYIDLPPEDVIHWRGYNPDDPLLGVSRLETLRDTLAEDSASQAATVELMKNGLKGGHIERPLEAPEWSPEAMSRFQEAWANQRTRSPRTDPVLEEGMKWVPTSLSPKDAELLAGRRFTVEEVARVYGVHPRVLGLSEGGSSTEIEDLRRQVYTDTLPPLTQPLAAQLDEGLLRTEFMEDDLYWEFNLNEKLRGDPDKRFQAITAAVGAPWLLRNEARALENRPPVEGGDEIVTPLNVLVGENPKPAPNVMGPQNPLGPPQGGGHREEAAAGPVEVKEVETPEPPRELPAPYAERALHKLLERFFTRQADSLRAGSGKFTAKRWNRELGDDLYVLLREIVGRESGERYDPAADDDPRLKVMAAGAAEGINEYVRQQLAGADRRKALERIQSRCGEAAGLLAAQAGEMALERKAMTMGRSLSMLMPNSDDHPVLSDRERLERLRLLRELALPDEVVWELAGFSQDEIDRMRALNHTSALLDASSNAVEPKLP